MKKLPVLLTFVALLSIGCGEKTVPATQAAPEASRVDAVNEKPANDPFSPRNPLENLSVVSAETPKPSAPEVAADPFPVSAVVEAPPETPIAETPKSLAPEVAADPFPVSPVVEAPPATPIAETPKSPAPEVAADPFPVSPVVEAVPVTSPAEAPKESLPMPPVEPAPDDSSDKEVPPMESPVEETLVVAPTLPTVLPEGEAMVPVNDMADAEKTPAETPLAAAPAPFVIQAPASVVPTENVTENLNEVPAEKVVEHSPASFVAESIESPVELSAEEPIKVAAKEVSQEGAQEGLRETSEKKPAYDPIKVNGEIFVDWPKPKLLLVFTGFMNGYVEPCGCAGIEQMKGGLSRRHSLFKELEEKRGWPVLAIDGGNLNKGFGRQEELKYNFVIDEALRLMDYKAVGIGNRELLFSTDDLILYVVDVPGSPKRYTSANVAVLAFDPTCTMPYRVLEENGVKVAVTSVLGPSFCKDINNEDIVHEDAVRKLKELLPKLAEENCDRKVLVVNGTTEETNRILKAVTGQFDFVIVSDTPAEPPLKPNWIENSMLIEVGEKGKFAVAIGLYDDPDTPVRYQRIPLDSRFKNSKEIVALMRLYQDQLKETGLKGLGIKPITERRAVGNGKYVGSKSCADCHEPSYGIWKKSRHAAAWRSLVETSNPPRTHDPECIACHVVGWSPTEFLPYENGFLGEKETPQLMDVGCESCHGPGENHNKAEQGSDENLKMALRKAMRLPLEGKVAKKLCIECHDGDNSPHFDFDTYWPKIVHVESEE